MNLDLKLVESNKKISNIKEILLLVLYVCVCVCDRKFKYIGTSISQQPDDKAFILRNKHYSFNIISFLLDAT